MLPPERPKGLLLAISPHLDDAVLSCGNLILECGGATVATVFAGVPAPDAPLTPWDHASGFRSGVEAVGMRRREDAAALELLGAHALWLDCLDSQYAPTPSMQRLAEAIRGAIQRVGPRTLAVPLGLYHPDHVAVANACFSLRADFPAVRWLAYEDVPYRCREGWLQTRLAQLQSAGVRASPLRQLRADVRKWRAVASYPSQLKAAGPGGFDDAASAEVYWSLEPVSCARKSVNSECIQLRFMCDRDTAHRSSFHDPLRTPPPTAFET